MRRTLTLPLLVFYGVGVTVGAGIFALIGEILDVSGNQAPLAFLVAGAIAGVTGLSYMQLVRAKPSMSRAGWASGPAGWPAPVSSSPVSSRLRSSRWPSAATSVR